MKAVLWCRATLIWALLILATAISWWLGARARHGGFPRWLATAVVVLAFVKVRYVMLDFMEIRNAPWALRIFAEAWVIVLCGVILLFEMDPQLQAAR